MDLTKMNWNSAAGFNVNVISRTLRTPLVLDTNLSKKQFPKFPHHANDKNDVLGVDGALKVEACREVKCNF
jgi:hypothetical protein